MDSLVGVLALATLGLAVLIVGVFYLRSLKSQDNRNAAKVVMKDESSAHTAVRGGSTPEHLR